MKVLETPMCRVDGARVQLAHLLRSLPDNNWLWSILEFDGVGRMPANASLLEFRKKVLDQPLGLIVTWQEISEFAESVDYTIDCILVAVSRIDLLNVRKILVDDFEGCEVVVRAVDSTVWVLGAASETIADRLERAALHS